MSDRYVPECVACLRPFVDAGVLGMTEVHVAATFVGAVGAVGGALDDDVVLAAALAVRGPLHGHVRVDLSSVAGSVVAVEPEAPPTAARSDVEGRDDEGSELDLPLFATDPGGTDPDSAGHTIAGLDGADLTGLPWPDPDGWAARVLASPLARADGDEPGDLVEPLVLDGDHVYLDRHWRDEVAVAEDLLARAGGVIDPDPARLEALDRYLPEAPDDGPDLQRRAAAAALERQLVVVAGGPGTGKTRTVARLLAVLSSGGDRPLEVALAAPTGKAAARLAEAIAAAVQEADPGPEVAARLTSLEARTIHRLLGARRSGASFARSAADPVPADVVVVDEVSMVSLPLMARLLEAVRPEARVVLVGDPHQLASVEAGAVLGDLVGRDGAPPAGLRDNVVTLERVHRFGAESPVGRLAAAIRDGDARSVISEVGSGRSGTAVERVDPGSSSALDALRDRVLAHARELVDVALEGRAADALDALGRLEVLCATRRGPLGVEEWNTWIEQRLRDVGLMRERWSPGRPIMVTANDHLNGVFNGDVGVVVRDPTSGRAQVAFAGVEGPRLLDPSRLDAIDTQWAMTIHKSQGSEFDHVVVTLPEPPSPILSRELLYTAVTRARQGVTVVASDAALRTAVERPVARSSGLAARLS